jgi:hypothetical protein
MIPGYLSHMAWIASPIHEFKVVWHTCTKKSMGYLFSRLPESNKYSLHLVSFLLPPMGSMRVVVKHLSSQEYYIKKYTHGQIGIWFETMISSVFSKAI